MKERSGIIHDSSKDIYTKLDERVNDFWEWSKTQKPEYEWETEYESWAIVNFLFSELVETTEHSYWSRKTINNLLYMIARDHECGILINKLCERPKSLLFLAQEGLFHPDPEVRWQLAHYLTKISAQYSEAEEIIREFSEDHDEYVRRRAILALGYIKSKYAEERAVMAWNTNLEYQRIAALEVLYQMKSKELEQYLKLARNSEFEYVRSNAERITKQLG
ncbi:HEAT repeat domain-containing protein [Saccharibacillus alkalitolerans]|uniref:HEAT repeat domain-containing protein n=1 Tax=Saccharibacillus alkalitolerans TaxID=2705290 RepID=A0ABX0FDD3_9BACL|nr:HEAT repeat domain-containing protein [Saccharibacillus alkalitolerans]NGZ77699.1 HEAT repeat domain-containing protein [Saccharibacillus alkalitolerans]